MTTARKLIYDGLREGNIIPANASLSATDIQNTELLPLLNGALFELIGEVIGEEPRDWAVPPTLSATTVPHWNTDPREQPVVQQPAETQTGSDLTYKHPPANSRLIVRISEADTVYLPPAPNDGALIQIVDLNSAGTLTLDANGRFINDASSITLDPVSSYNSALFMYRADKGSWYQVSELAIDDPSPLPSVFDDVLSIQLYFRAASRYGSTPSSATVAAYSKKLAKLKKRYRQHQPRVAPDASPRTAIQEYSGLFYQRR